MEKFGPKNFGAIVSDNGGGCEKGRLLVKEAYPHINVQRCMMHGFALIMGSTFGHKKPLDVIKKCQKLVTATKQSHKVKHWVHEEYVHLPRDIQSLGNQDQVPTSVCQGGVFCLHGLADLRHRILRKADSQQCFRRWLWQIPGCRALPRECTPPGLARTSCLQ
ncbi:hypothetical protein ABBQ32_004463 [Trebouxia sp. C0010 RCD-2024]